MEVQTSQSDGAGVSKQVSSAPSGSTKESSNEEPSGRWSDDEDDMPPPLPAVGCTAGARPVPLARPEPLGSLMLPKDALPSDEPNSPFTNSLMGRRGMKKLSVSSGPMVSTSGVGSREPKLSIRRLDQNEALQDLYILEEELHTAEANQCKVMSARSRKEGKSVIIKMRSKRFASGGEHVWRSVLERMLNLDAHCHVLGLVCVLEDDQKYYVVMERCNGGELFDFLSTETDVPERECKRIMVEILEAVDHIHSRGLIHRDIKPENIMFHDVAKDPPPLQGSQIGTKSPQGKKTIKLIDFDTCLEYEPTTPKPKHVVGTMGYIAPEALRGEYSPASDLWSVGVILYILMTGDMPFDMDSIFEDGQPNRADTKVGSATMEELYTTLSKFEIDFDCEPWPTFPKARDLCKQLLAFDPECRSPSARDALKHPWLSD